MSVVVVATFLPKPEYRDEVAAVLLAAIPAVHKEDGCELYSLNEGRDRLVMIEQWASGEALKVHGQSPALAGLGPSMEGKLTAAIDVQVLTPHPAGDASLGVVRPSV